MEKKYHFIYLSIIVILLVIIVASNTNKQSQTSIDTSILEKDELLPSTSITNESNSNKDEPTPVIVEAISQLEQFMKDNSITLTAKDVQYDLINNVDKNFAIEGYAELSDYYNYGFDDCEKDYFCMRVEPIDGSYSDSWYIYCHRISFTELFNELKSNNYSHVIINCKIPEYVYEQGQGNMAYAERIMW